MITIGPYIYNDEEDLISSFKNNISMLETHVVTLQTATVTFEKLSSKALYTAFNITTPVNSYVVGVKNQLKRIVQPFNAFYERTLTPSE